MTLHSTIPARTAIRNDMYRNALKARRMANAGFFGRIMLRVGI